MGLLSDLEKSGTPGEALTPALDEEIAVRFHQLPRALRGARAVADVDDARARLEDRAQPALVQPKAEVRVLEIRGREGLVEPAQFEEERPRHEHARRGAEVDVAPKAVPEIVGVASASDCMCVADRVHD